MNIWFTSSDSGHFQPSLHSSHVLATISGNAQSFATDSKHQLDYKPYLHTIRAVSEPQYLAPCVTLGSNDRQPLTDRLAFHKARRSSQASNKVLRERPYLQNEKYLEYRKRKRQDVGKDGKPIWPDHIEAAFQNALVNIPPLGRKKRTQRGKLLGRNELIREWILQETGEERHRKQISSHIQVLGNVFKGVPEWKMVTSRIGIDNGDDDDRGTDYYFGSIADKVRVLNELSSMGNFEHDNIDELVNSPSTINRMTFDMWVGMPDEELKSLHHYTRILEPDRPLSTTELERYENWETLFPDLKGLLEESQVDVVLLKSRFNLMSDYPPTTSKLVLDLDLDFRNFASERGGNSWMRYFTSVNHLYHNGKKMRKSEHKYYLAIEPGVVKPFFEAEWWAAQFTKVTRKMKEAEEAKDMDMSANVDGYSRSLFRGLTIMQEIFVSPQHSECMTSHSHKKRVAILLWVFAQTDKDNPGTTTWQHVTVQSSSFSEFPMDDACLPSLSLDEVVDDPFNIDMAGNSFGVDTSTPMSPIPYELGTYHSGFTPYHTTQEAQANFDFSDMTRFTPRAHSFTGVKPDPMNLMMPISHVPPFLPSQTVPEDKVTLFTLPTQPSYEDHSGPGPATYVASEPLSAEYSLRRDSLAHFDMTTHDMLQAQLENFTDAGLHHPPQDQLEEFQASQAHDSIQLLQDSAQPFHDTDIDINLRLAGPTPIANADPDSQNSMIGHINSLDLDEESLSQAMLTADNDPTTPTLNHAKLMLAHPTLFESPKLTRPPLLAHNSFAGVLPDAKDELLHFDTPTRNEFARVIGGQLDRDRDLFGVEGGMDGFIMIDTGGIGELGRPRSQPVLGSNEYARYSRLDPVYLESPV